ncbi:virulence RhuM family protein [Candidatus Albibeggiatoa sp. nov. BB20]|uniref:virulence RhuM family protein n=1 Tax=Candidatus Albibeggiatoa sp. nov. BB20 TaxID=3162723 RepID=UPI0033655DF0
MSQQDIIIYQTQDNKVNIVLYVRDGDVWLTQNQLAELFATSKQNISSHIINILQDKELEENSVVKNYLTTATDGKQYPVQHYALPMILAIGFRVRSIRGTQFRQWANRHLQSYLIKGFVMDDERLKNPDGRPDYFDEMLARIRDIRASEKRFYQKIRDLFALSSDYDNSDKATQMFFAEIQNKLLFAVTQQTAAEIIMTRASAEQNNMGLTTWKGSVVRKQDIYIAKNYLNADEIDTLNRLVVIFLETAELRAKNRIDTTMNFWRQQAEQLIESNGFALLQGQGSVSKQQMEQFALTEYERFDAHRKQQDAEIADKMDETELHQLEKQLKQR